MKIAVILGTRPEIIKMAPLIKELERRNSDFFILHTGQHYSYQLDKVFFEQMELPQPKYNLDAGSGSHAEETARMLIGIEDILIKEKPDAVITEGDTNSVLAGGLAAAKLNIKIGHVEAGLRSYDRTMPEEINRILIDHISDFLFAPTAEAQKILLNEGIPEAQTYITGNTIVDAVNENVKIAQGKKSILETLNLKAQQYLLVTLHRQENVDNHTRFTSILTGIEMVCAAFNLPAVYPLHPRSRKMMQAFGIQPSSHFIMIEPADLFSFLQLENRARLVLTDSGGVQEETCILHIPCITLRDNTERPETVTVGANLLAGAVPEKILECARTMINKNNNWENPFGDGKASQRIVTILEGKL
jgi:UDP-N-acetylglucosamine 2-epimerase (non-hydrolysing)